MFYTHIEMTSERAIFRSPMSFPTPGPSGCTPIIHTVPPQPTTSFSLCLTLELFLPAFGVSVPFEVLADSPFDPNDVFVGSISASRLLSSTHSALAFQTPAISSQPGRLGRSTWLIRFHADSYSAFSMCRFERIIFIPCSLTHTTNLPDSDHLIMLIAPSPECKIVSLPVFEPKPIDPNQPEADAAVLPVVVEVELVPERPPTVSMSFPARPPERYDRSFL